MSILDLERHLDSLLSRPRVTDDTVHAIPGAGGRWSAAVWKEAQLEGPMDLTDLEVSRGLAIARRPVFVFGTHRSGTTLVRDLLDGHPALAVLPSEGTFFTSLAQRLRRLPRTAWLSEMGQEWLRRLANPIHQAPYWLLGRSSEHCSPYVTFARTLLAWWPITAAYFGRVASSWPLVSVALAYAQYTAGFSPPRLERWVEKTPMNERFIHRLRSEFPQAKLIHVVRHPYAVYASRKETARAPGESFRAAQRTLRELNLTHRVIARHRRCHTSDGYLLIRYEDVLSNPAGTVERIAAFLEIESLPTLMQPTAASVPTASNSSYVSGATPGRINTEIIQRWKVTLTTSERERIAAAIGRAPATLGYELAWPPGWRAQLMRFVARVSIPLRR